MTKQTWQYQKRHNAVVKICGKAKFRNCSFCLSIADVWATIHGLDGSEPYHYVPLCHPCHNRYDHDLQHTPESDRARGATWRGKNRPEEFGKHMSRVLSGRVFSDESKRRMSESQKRLARDPEHIEKLRERGRKGALVRWRGGQ